VQESFLEKNNTNKKSISLADLLKISEGKIINDKYESFMNNQKNIFDCSFTNVAPLHEASKEHISFIIDSKYLNAANSSHAGIILCKKELALQISESSALLIVCEYPRAAFGKISQFFYQPQHHYSGVSSQSMIDMSAKISETATIFPYVFIGPGAIIGERTVLYPGCFVGAASSIGDDCILYPNVVIREGCIIGDNCIFNPGAVIGGDGFGFEHTPSENVKIPQIGTVEIFNHVEIGSNATVDRAVFGKTKIGDQTKIDNLVQVAHNVQIGKGCLFAAQTGIAGSTQIGNRVMAGGHVAIKDHIKIGNDALLVTQAGVAKHIPSGAERWAGSPARPLKKFFKSSAILNKIVQNYISNNKTDPIQKKESVV